MIGLAILCWATLGVLLAAFLRMAMRPDVGYGAAGRGRGGRRSPASSSAMISPGSISSYGALRS